MSVSIEINQNNDSLNVTHVVKRNEIAFDEQSFVFAVLKKNSLLPDATIISVLKFEVNIQN